ncbi:MAG: hypothetical protein M5U19_01450 [Microthrixaceae bacterium]|nr:hypothetical protein [Microthrixaceae bacterium]
MAITCAVATTAIAVAVLLKVDHEGTQVAAMGGWPGRIAINLVADRFSALMLTVGAVMLLAVLLFAIGQRADDERSRWYHPAYLVLTAGVSGRSWQVTSSTCSCSSRSSSWPATCCSPSRAPTTRSAPAPPMWC